MDLINLNQDDPWDVIIAGDGSGSRWGYGGGWAAILFDKATNKRKTCYGALDDTTVNICELSPYIYTTLWYHRGPARQIREAKRKAGQLFPTINVHIITDCEVIAQQGNRILSRDANAPLWASFDSFERLGFSFRFHHVPRDVFAANRVCDKLSKDMRHLIESIEKRLDDTELPDSYDDQFGREEPQE